ncbi:uncharacterized protein [Miscanthus floridulus]|uniref:uncharacterized protein n=1 Tax=Miscanthus floridulus TaxID=154761 RepID=UPI0034582B09
MVCGDFNMIYMAADKNNDHLDRRGMRRSRSFLDTAQLEELHLNGRRFTWSSERDQPTLERLDRLFATTDWLVAYPNHMLKALSTDCSDHCPLLLVSNAVPWAKKRFRFEPHWIKIPGFLDVAALACSGTLIHADPCRILDHKLRNVAKALKSWSDKRLGSVRLQLALAREVILRFDVAQEMRALSAPEAQLRKMLKVSVLGLASLKRRNYINSLRVNGKEVLRDEEMPQALYQYYVQVKLRARRLWNAVDKGTDNEEDEMSVFEAILAAVPTEYRESLGAKSSAKEAWEAIAAMRVGRLRAVDERLEKATATKDSGKLLPTKEEWAAWRNSRKAASSSRGGKGKHHDRASSEKKQVDPNACRRCGKMVHWARECPNRKREKKAEPMMRMRPLY